MLVWTGSLSAQTTNSIPFSDSFESYSGGESIDGTNGWSGAGVVTNLAYTYDSVSNGYPIAGSHTNVLDFSDGITNQIDGAASSVVWIDAVMNAGNFWPGPDHPSVDTNANACIYVNTNGNLVAGHTQYGGSNLTWTVFDDVVISSNDWNRIALQLDYLTHYYSVMINGVVGGAWFPMIGNFPFAAVALEGDAFIDDLVVSGDAPYASISVADAGSIAEGDSGTTLANFTISLSTNTSVPVMIDYATADGTATAGVDYIAKSGTATIPAGDSQAVIGVEVIGDTDTESDVDFTLNISNPLNTIITDDSGSATINDDDMVVAADLIVSGSTLKINDAAPNSASGWGVTNYFSATETIDWVVWNSSAVTPSERKSGGSSFTGFSSSQSWSSGSGNRIFIAWEDGTVLPAATNFNGLAMADVGVDVPYTAMDFSVDLDAVQEGGYYKLRIYSTDKRNDTSVKYWDADSGSYVIADSETDNDAGDLRIYEITISNVTANATLPLQIAGKRTGSGFPVVMGGMELVLVGSLLPPPEEGGYAGWTGDFNLSGTNALMTTDVDSSGYNNLYEYAFGGNPTNIDDNGTLPTHSLDGSDIEYIYLRRNDTNLAYSVVVGTNLVTGSWSTNGVLEVGSATFDADFDSVTNHVPTAGKTNGFIRLKVDAL
jgi:hypothetical protein